MLIMENNYKLTKISWLIFAGILFAVPLHSQTIVEVMADQPEKFEIIVSEELYYETDSSIVFGQDISVQERLTLRLIFLPAYILSE